MPRLEIISPADAATLSADGESYPAGHRARGVRTSRLLQPEGYSLWVCVSELTAGAEVHWDGSRGDEAVYVARGALEIEGRECPADGALIVESGVRTAARAVGETEIVHFGPSDPTPPSDGQYGAPQPKDHGVHVVGPGAWFESGAREGTRARWYADSTCPTCRLCLLHVEHESPRDGPIHHHSEDEIIYVTGGSLGLGPRRFEPGTALFIGADARYRITTPEGGYRFLNYRRDVSLQTYDKGDPPLLESALARGGREIGDLL